MIDQATLESGYYWVRLKYQVTVNGWQDVWEICHWSSGDNRWTDCGNETDIPPYYIFDIEPERLKHKTTNSEVEPDVFQKENKKHGIRALGLRDVIHL